MQRCAQFVGHVSQEVAFGLIGGLRRLACLDQLAGARLNQLLQVIAVLLQLRLGLFERGDVDQGCQHIAIEHDPGDPHQTGTAILGADSVFMGFDGGSRRIGTRHGVFPVLPGPGPIVRVRKGQGPPVHDVADLLLGVAEDLDEGAIELMQIAVPGGKDQGHR